MARSTTWQTQIAKAQFSHLIKAACEEGDQFISLRGEEVAVVLSKERYNKLTKPSGSLLDFFKNAPLQDVDLSVERTKDLPREIDL